MQDKKFDQNRSTHEQKNNPEKLAVNDEAQRTTVKESGERPKNTPTGNERDEPNTAGSQAGMGE